ncbi:hypothetical protein D9M68_985240 [compost metagenome]
MLRLIEVPLTGHERWDQSCLNVAAAVTCATELLHSRIRGCVGQLALPAGFLNELFPLDRGEMENKR